VKKILLVAAIGLVAGALGFAVYLNSKQKAETEAAAVAAAEASAAAQATDDELVLAAVLPEFSLKNRDGQMQSIKSWPGKSLIINFWATWCGPCRREIPLLMKTHEQRANDGFMVVGIAIDFHDEVVKYANEMKMNYPLLSGEQDGMAAADAFGVNSLGLPFTVFTANDGRIVMLHMGEIHEPQLKIVLDGVGRVNSGELTPDAARAAIAQQLMDLPPEKPAAGDA
jgi:thiol-disulfide isomerase/thioredoxin